ncbi:Leucine-rich_repeat domain superfamily [Hexamita inflata]|uniref:Leucine-rich repeat domain superfamily n=1 Tax=Hexamita inflata TaxID=28002 RepID=A0AA86PZH6_9EUKA|nr:Leucine-rich repeat domain superfamily [Hexamita inflata]
MPFQFTFPENQNTQDSFTCNFIKSTIEKPARPFMFSWYKAQINGHPPTLRIFDDSSLGSLSFIQEFKINQLFLEFIPNIIYDLKSEIMNELKLCHCPPIQNMEWIQQVPNLKILYLYDICIQYLNGLETCNNFAQLCLTKCKINDISAQSL